MVYVMIAIVLILTEMFYIRLVNKTSFFAAIHEREKDQRPVWSGAGLLLYLGMLFFSVIHGFVYPGLRMGACSCTGAVYVASAGFACNTHLVYLALSVCLYLLFDDALGVYGKPRIAHDDLCIYIRIPFVYLRNFVADAFDPFFLESHRIPVSFHSRNTGVCTDQHDGSNPE